MSLSPAESLKQPDNRAEKSLLGTAAVIAVATVVAVWFAMRFATVEILEHQATSEARSWAQFISGDVDDPAGFLSGEAISTHDYQLLDTAENVGDVFSYRIIGPDGAVTQASNPGSIGTWVDTAFFRDLVSKGKIYTRISYSEGDSTVPSVYGEAFVPVIRDGRFLGAIGAYIDVSDLAENIARKTQIALLGLAGIFFLLCLSLGAVYLRQARRQEHYLKTLRESADSHQRLVDFMPYPIMVHVEGSIIYANSAMLEKFGYQDLDQVIGTKAWEIVHESQRERIRDGRMKRTASGKRNAPLEFRFLCADGSEFDGEAAAAPFIWNEQRAAIVGIVDFTDRKKNEEALRKSEARYRSLLNILPDGIRINRDGMVIYANRAEARLLGAKSPDELVGKPARFMPPEEMDKVRERQELLKKGGVADWRENARLRLDGSRVPVESAAIPIDWDDEPANLLVTRDITEKLEATRQLEESHARYRSLIDASPDAIRVHVAGQIVFANAAAAELFGADAPDDLIGLWGDQFFHPDDMDSVREMRESLGAQQSIPWHDSRRLRLDGSVIEVEAASLPVDWNGEIAQLVMNRDISARRAAEQQNTRLGRIVDESTNEVYVFDDDGLKFLQVNRAARENLGFTEEELLNMTPIDIKPEFSASEFDEMLEPLRSGAESSLRFETIHRRKNGTYYDVLINLQLMHNDTSRAFAAIVQDITERKKFEFSLRLAKEEAEVAAQSAEAANRAKSEFLATMSHEIRTPMNGILGMASMLLEGDLDDEQRDQAEVITTSGQALLTIINDILDFSKLEAGKLELEYVPMSPAATFEGVIELVESQASDRGLELASFISPKLARQYLGDSGRLRQILLNLASNAVKFTTHGSVSISADIVREDHKSIALRVEVADTGIGLSEEAKNKLFEKFVQADASTTRKFGGTGLGLAICKQIVELMGGDIGVESIEGRGSTFWFEIALETVGPPAEKDVTAEQEGYILVVFENTIGRAALVRQIKAFGYSAVGASDAETAIAAIRRSEKDSEPFDAILIDQSIDRTAGASIRHALARAGAGPDTRCILLTNRGLSGEAARQMNPDVDAFLSKPVRASRLQRVLSSDPGSENETADKEGSDLAAMLSSEDRGLRILLAEDNSVNQRVAMAMLSKGGHQIDIANDGVEALMLVSQNEYDVVLMDVQMPNMSGIDATRKIRRLPGPNANVPIIAMTANAMVGDRESYLDAGMNDYVSKPIDPNLLSAALTRQSGHETTATAISGASSSETPERNIPLSDLDDVLSEMDSLLETE